MTLFRLLSWPYFRRHVLRTLLTAAGIVLGVAVFVGMRAANASVLAAFAQTIDRIAGRTELEVTAGETGFGEDVLETVQLASTVRVAVPVIEATVQTNLAGQGSLLVLGIDMTGDRTLRDYDLEGDGQAVIDDPLIFLAQPDSLIVSEEFARRNGLAIGSALALGTLEGERLFTVRGIMRSSPLTSSFGGSLAVMDVYAAQRMFGRGRTFDRIDLAVQPGSSLADCQSELTELLGSGFDVQPPARRGQQFESMLAGYSMTMSVSSAFALFIGMFIIYNAFAIAVTERRSEIGILRALGATRGQIQRLFLAESLIVGLLGSAVGVGVGMMAARLIAATVSELVTDVYRVAQPAETLTIPAWVIGVAFGLGVATSVVAALLPARAAARVEPVEALKKGSYNVLPAVEGRRRLVVSVSLGAIGALGLLAGESRVLFYAGYASLLVAAVLSASALAQGVARSLRPILRLLRPLEGGLAADSLIAAPKRTAASVTALMLALAIVVAFEGMARANHDSIADWADTVLNPDFFVVPSPSLETRTARFPAAMSEEIAGLDGVERVQKLRNSRIRFRDGSAMLLAMEMESIAQTVTREPVAGTSEEMYRRAAAGEGLIVSDNFAELNGLELGDVLEIAAPYGEVRLPIAGIIVDYTDQQGSILVDLALFVRYWRDDTVNMFRVYIEPGVEEARVRQQILELYEGRRQVFVLTNDDLRTYVADVVGQWFGLTSVQIAVAVLVAVLGIINTMTVSITDRRRELGVLQAIGGLRRQIRQIVWLEAVTIGMIGVILGCALGAVNLYYVLEIARHDVSGMRLDYTFPTTTVLFLMPTILAAAFLAALWPARSAVRGPLVEALEYE